MVTRCVAAAPCHGEQWCSIAKATENRRLSKDAILQKVVAAYYAAPATTTTTAAATAATAPATTASSAATSSSNGTA